MEKRMKRQVVSFPIKGSTFTDAGQPYLSKCATVGETVELAPSVMRNKWPEATLVKTKGGLELGHVKKDAAQYLLQKEKEGWIFKGACIDSLPGQGMYANTGCRVRVIIDPPETKEF